MGDVIIRAEGLGKKYRISHQGKERYTALRDVIADKVRGVFRPSAAVGGHSAAVEDFWALRDVSFEVKRGEVVGIIGRNGAGKSTLLKILSRITEPTEGRVELDGRVASLLEVGTGFHPELTGRENIFLNGAILGMTRAETRRKFDEIVAFSEVEKFLDTPVKRYSSGMYVRLAFAVAAHIEPEILIVDEVLAVGDREFQQKCLGKIGEVAKGGRTVLFVSHNLSVIRTLCSRGIFLSNGRIAYIGDVEHALSRYSSSGPQTNRKAYPSTAPLKWIEVEQVGPKLSISACYRDLKGKLTIPGLGFVIFDMLGQPLFGHNPMLDSMISPFSAHEGEGIVVASVEKPSLLDGQYFVSIWFGDDATDLFHDPHCIKFEIAGMAIGKQLPAHRVGSISPTCIYEFILPKDPRFRLLDRSGSVAT